MKIMDCTLRDGGNVVGNGFSPELTKMMIEGLLRSNIRIIEMGNAKGLGATAKGSPAPISDEAYLDLIHPYLDKAEIGMFLNRKRFEADNVAMAADKGISFLRLGTDAGDGEKTYEAVEIIKKHGIKVRYSMMKAYLLTPEELAEEAAGLEAHGVDEVTIMDSAGTMHPADAGRYVEALKARIKIPVGFHGHNNLGLSAANALAAAEHGADILDCGLLGMACLLLGIHSLAITILACVFFAMYWQGMPAQVTGYMGSAFGPSFPKIWGLATLIIMGIGPALGSYLGARLYVVFGSYRVSFIMALVMFGLSAFFALTLPKKIREMEQRSDG